MSKRSHAKATKKLKRSTKKRRRSSPSAGLLARAFNEWMRRYTDEPERFEREFNTVADFRFARAHELEPEYGRRCAEYLIKLVEEQGRR
jgi:hypothetical protein